MKWLITGGCGFIGSNLVARLATDPSNHITVIDNLSVGSLNAIQSIAPFVPVNPLSSENPSSQYTFFAGDIRDHSIIPHFLSGVDFVVHLAANTGVPSSVYEPFTDCNVNISGLLNYLHASVSCSIKKFIFASSSAPAGSSPPPIHEEIVPRPLSPYGASKLAGEAYCAAYYHTHSLNTVALRFSNVYGPRSSHKSSVVARFINDLICSGSLSIHGDGTQTRDFIYVNDLVDSIILSCLSPHTSGQIYQIGTGTPLSVGDLASKLTTLLSSYTKQSYTINYKPSRIADICHSYCDPRKAFADFSWVASTSLEVGLQHTIESVLSPNV